LLTRYLEAFGPATVTDFALWMGLYVRDAGEIWSRAVQKMVQVDVEGWKAHVLQSDLSELESAEIDHETARLLPSFDTYLLGHKSHRSMVNESNQREIYRAQGWVSPVVLVDGRAQGVWSYEQRKDALEVRITPFTKFSSGVASQLREEAAGLGAFLGSSSVKIAWDKLDSPG
jgi:DNA glycosylase AlkZ-like